MKGKILFIYEKFICEAYSEEHWDQILEASNQVRLIEFVSPKSDIDKEFKALIVASSRVIEIAIPDLLGLFGLYAFTFFEKSLPQYFENAKSLFDVLPKLPEILANDIRAALPDVYLPEINIEVCAQGHIDLNYQSKRKMCEFLEGLILACASTYGEEIKITHNRCMHYGHDFCSMTIMKTE